MFLRLVTPGRDGAEQTYLPEEASREGLLSVLDQALMDHYDPTQWYFEADAEALMGLVDCVEGREFGWAVSWADVPTFYGTVIREVPTPIRVEVPSSSRHLEAVRAVARGE